MSFRQAFKNIDFLLLILIFLSITIFPPIRISGLPVIGLEDVLMPLVLYRLYKSKSFKPTPYIWIILAFMGYIFLTILINRRYDSIQDYFEIYKMGKFLLVVLFSQYVFKDHLESFTWIIKSVFIYLFVFNLFHYFSLFNFNEVVMPYFSLSKIHLSFFGLDSLGNPQGKRMIGTMSNPNINAVLFLFFYTFFIVKYGKKGSFKQQVWIYLPFLCLLLTQSRTALVSLVVVTLLWLFYAEYDFKRIFGAICTLISVVFIVHLFNKYSLTYYTNVETHVIPSMQGRFKFWNHLLEMIMQKPFLGHGPNKNYFYDNRLYSESEYILYLWRYGFVGMFFYLSWIFMPINKTLLKVRGNAHYYLIVIVILINAITNNPLSNPNLLLLFALSIGYYFAFAEKRIELELISKDH